MGQLTQSRNDVYSRNDWCSLSSSAADFNTPASEKGVHQVVYKECLPAHCQYFHHHYHNRYLTLISNSTMYLCVRVTDLSRMRTRKSRLRIEWVMLEAGILLDNEPLPKKSATQRASKLLQLLLHLALLAHRSTIPQWLLINCEANNYLYVAEGANITRGIPGLSGRPR